ncbi:hypothetical protein ACMD2_19049 [Ananas comosus]|uniref:Uncharacterized protein n=1 Tax=Ananas comosus TaxID=4615 RepID=A0A199VYL7_ANACO|nr:hypothetical protein ACMD2_19049 [Ananas comosus]
MDDLLDADMGKHDYDWLLTPPGTPRDPFLDSSEKPPSSAVPKRSATRSSSTTRASRLSASQPDPVSSSRPIRSSSVSRPSISSISATFASSNNNRTSILNTSTSSITSRPLTPSRRTPPTLTTPKPSAPAARPVPARSSTPIKARPPSTSQLTKPASAQSSRPSTPTSRPRITPVSNSTNSTQNSRPSTPTSRTKVTPTLSNTNSAQNSRPSTPTSRSQITSGSSTNTSSSVARASSRSSTPTRQPISTGRSPSVGRVPVTSSLTSSGRAPTTSGRNSAPSSRANSPSPRPRAPVRPLDIPDFPNDTPPNLRTKLPERPSSAGRVRPGMALTVRANTNSEPAAPLSLNKRISLPVVSRSKFTENPSKAPLISSSNQTKPEIQKPVVSEAEARRPIKSASASESSGFGRTISKKSLDMALRHMDIRQNLGGIRGASLFPHSIRSSASKGRPARMSDPVVSLMNDEDVPDNRSTNGTISMDCNGSINGESTANNSPDIESFSARETSIDYGSSRYDAILLREDLKNTNWLHSTEDKADLSPMFDHRFEPLPEPFGPL